MKKLLPFLLTLLLLPMTTNAATHYVKTDGVGNKSGSSWANASNDLQAMINQAQANDLVFVAEGDYFPNKASNHLSGDINPHNRDNAFVLKKDVKIYGSFPANANDSQHNTIDSRFSGGWILNTYLLGDITGNKNWTEFSHHVLISVGDVGSALIDGFVIANGNANGSGSIKVNEYEVLRDMGGGMHSMSSSPSLYGVIISDNKAKYGGGMLNVYSSATITEVTIDNNSADYVGGGMYNFQSSPILSNTTFSDNLAGTDGGGMMNRNSSPSISGGTFKGNIAKSGGGMYNHAASSSPIIKYVDFVSNTANFGGGIFNSSTGASILFQNVVIYKNRTTEGGGAGVANNKCDPTFLNVVIAENRSRIGAAGMSNVTASPVLINTTISRNYANTSGTYGGALSNSMYSSPKVYNSIIWGNVGYPQVYNVTNSTPSYFNSLVETATKNSGTNLDGSTDPLFIGGTNDDYDYYLLENSPCIDKGNNEHYTTAGGNLNADVDLLRNPRLAGSSIDMGAYESKTGSGISEHELKTSTNVIGLEGQMQFIGMQNTEVSIFSLDGNLLYSYRIDSNPQTISISEGIYIVSSLNGISRKVIIR